MPKTRVQKEKIVSELSDKLSRMKSAVFTNISGYTMGDANTLRAKGREHSVELMVAKKTLLAKALEANNLEITKDDLGGSVLTTMGFNDEMSAAKLMADFIKEREQITIIGGILEGKFVGPEAIKQLATLPSRNELLAKLVGSINAPVSGFVNVLAGNLRGLVNVLNSIKDAKTT